MKLFLRLIIFVAFLTWCATYILPSISGTYHEITFTDGSASAMWFPSYVRRKTLIQGSSDDPYEGISIWHQPFMFIDRTFIHPTVITVENNGELKRIAQVSSEGKIITP